MKKDEYIEAGRKYIAHLKTIGANKLMLENLKFSIEQNYHIQTGIKIHL